MQKPNKHKAKVRLARRMVGGRIGIKVGNHSFKTSLFGNALWVRRSIAIRERILRRQEAASRYR